jgi:hypothetical protein
MVKRRKDEDLAGILEFDGRDADDPEFKSWLADHAARKGGKIRVAKGGKGVRVAFTSQADLAVWKARADKLASGKKPAAP